MQKGKRALSGGKEPRPRAKEHDAADEHRLYPSVAPMMLKEGTFSGVLAESTITATNLEGPLKGMTISDLVDRIKQRRAYVNVHTKQNPGGEIAGAIQQRGDHAIEEGQKPIRHLAQHQRDDARAATCGRRQEVQKGKGR